MKCKYNKRVLVSFDGECPMKCKHCYTYDLEFQESSRTIEQLVQSIEKRHFDIIYISQSYENFIDEKKGLKLCKKLYDTYHKDILIITRSILSDEVLLELKKLNEEMKKNGNQMFLAVSVCADESYGITEDILKCPEPRIRLNNLKKAYNYSIKTILMLRPIFPEKLIPVQECLELIKSSQNYINAVVSGGLIVTDTIIEALHIDMGCIQWSINGDSEYLKDLDKSKVKYIDVKNEMKEIEIYCQSISVPFFRHSMPALNYIG